MSLLLDTIARHVVLTAEEQQCVLDLLETRRYKAKTQLQQTGMVCSESYFVNSGILRSFTYDDHAHERVLNFAGPGWWMADLYSLYSGLPGILNIDVIAYAEVHVLSKANQELMYREIPKMERFFRILVENALVAQQQRMLDNMMLSAEQRYDKFCAKFPGLIANVPQKLIASYIGVTPEFFSKMKAARLRGGIS